MSDKEIKTSKPAYKYGLIIAEPQKRLWVCEMDKGVVLDTLYTDTWGGNRMKGTREKTIENAKLIVKALNTFDASADAPYCHDLEQRIEFLEMELEAAETKISYNEWLEGELVKARVKAETYDRLMSMNSISENDIQIVLDGNAWCAYRLPFRNLQEDNAGFGVTPQMALTALLESELPDGWEEK